MNYNEFNDGIELPDDLYEKTKSFAKRGIAKHNKVYRKRRTALLSAAACLAVFAISVVSVKYFKQDQLAPSGNTTINSTPSTTADNPVNTPTKNDTVIYLENNNDKHPPQDFALNGKIYWQYSLGKSYEETKIKINQSDIGEMICELGAENLARYSTSYEQWTDNLFNKAKVYKYTRAKSDNIVIVQTTDGMYYLFSLFGLTDDQGMSGLLNAYTAGGANEIIGIEIWQNTILEFPDEFGENGALLGIERKEDRPIQKGIIKDKNEIQSILSILGKEQNRFTDFDNPDYFDRNVENDNYKLMSDYGVYELRIIFSDGQELELPGRNIDYSASSAPSELVFDPSTLDIFVQKLCISPFVEYNEQQDTGPYSYSLSIQDYNELAAILESNISK